MSGFTTILLIAVPLLALYGYLYVRSRNGEWHPTSERSKTGQPQMARMVNGEWQYREMTDEESEEEWQARQW